MCLHYTNRVQNGHEAMRLFVIPCSVPRALQSGRGVGLVGVKRGQYLIKAKVYSLGPFSSLYVEMYTSLMYVDYFF